MPTHPHLAPYSAPAREGSDPRVGVLVLHGFTGSPVSVRPWADHLQREGYAVDVPLLPGHGTTWQEMNTTSWPQWYDECERGLDRLLAANDRVVVAGLSMGAALGLLLAARRGSDVTAVVSVNASIDNRDPRRFALPLLKRVVPSFPGIVDDIKKPGMTELGYPRLPLRAAHSLLGLYKELQPVLPQVTQPLLLVRSSVDHVADPGSHRMVLGRVSSREVQELELGDSFHVATLDNDAPTLFAESTAFIEKVTRT